MRVIVHSDLELSGTTLIDTRLGVRYFLTPDAAWLLGRLRREPRVEYLVPAVARHQRITQKEARQAVYALLGLLEPWGGIRIEQQRALGKMRLPQRAAWQQRYPDSLVGFVRGMGRAYGSFLLVSVLIFAVFKVTLGARFATFWVTMPAGILSTCIVHEAGHAVVAKAYNIPFVFLARSGAAAIMYTQPQANQARWIAVFGPLAAILCCGLSALLSTSIAAQVLWVIAALIHACSFLPFLADGKTIWRTI